MEINALNSLVCKKHLISEILHIKKQSQSSDRDRESIQTIHTYYKQNLTIIYHLLSCYQLYSDRCNND